MISDTYFPAIRKLAEYEVWCQSRVLETARGLTKAELFQVFPFGLKTIHATVFHAVEVFQLWGGCVAPTITKLPVLPYNPGMPVGGIALWSTELSEAFLKAIDASHAAGVLHQDRRIENLFHLITHGTHHRTQFITMLRMLGKDPPYEAGDFGGWSKGS